jgi:Ca2+-binding RTX toxin-like protein
VTGSGDADLLTNTSGSATFTGLAGADTFTSTANTMTITDLGADNEADVVVIALGASVTAEATGNWTATAATQNNSALANGVINVTNDMDVSVALAAGTFGWTIDATGNAAASTLIGSSMADSIIGGAGADMITGGASADMLTGGDGADTFVYATGATGIMLATADTITDFTTADDSISTGIAGIVAGDVTIAEGTGLADFDAFVIAANAAFNAGGDDVYVAWNATNGGNAWVAINNNGGVDFTAGDSLIVLTGINTGAEISLANFIA